MDFPMISLLDFPKKSAYLLINPPGPFPTVSLIIKPSDVIFKNLADNIFYNSSSQHALAKNYLSILMSSDVIFFHYTTNLKRSHTTSDKQCHMTPSVLFHLFQIHFSLKRLLK